MKKNRRMLSQAEEQTLARAITRHNELSEQIAEFIETHDFKIVGEEVIFDNPPKELFIEYYNNFVDNIQEHVQSGRLSVSIGGIA